MRKEIYDNFQKMLKNGTIPIVEYYGLDGNGCHYNGDDLLATLHFGCDNPNDGGHGVYIYWEFENDSHEEIKPYFDSVIRKRHDCYYISFAEIDRMGYNLDYVLQFLAENFQDGVLSQL